MLSHVRASSVSKWLGALCRVLAVHRKTLALAITQSGLSRWASRVGPSVILTTSYKDSIDQAASHSTVCIRPSAVRCKAQNGTNAPVPTGEAQ